MKQLLILTILTASALTWTAHGQCGAAGTTCKAATEPAAVTAPQATINGAGLEALIKAKTPVLIFDARSGKYDDGRRIPGARSLTAESSPEAVAAVAPDKGALIVTYCAGVHCPASAALAKHLRSLGYENVVEFPGGIEAWVAEGRTITTTK